MSSENRKEASCPERSLHHLSNVFLSSQRSLSLIGLIVCAAVRPHKTHISFKLDHVLAKIKSAQLLNEVQLRVRLYFGSNT